MVKHNKTDEITCADGTSIFQFVSDKTGHDLATLDGQNTNHALGTIAIANGKCFKLFNSTTKSSAR